MSAAGTVPGAADMTDQRDGPVLVTGGAGFIGSNLAERIAADGRDVIIFDSLARPGVERNVAWLSGLHGSRIRLVHADIRDARAVREAVRDAAVVFHFAAQVAVTTSLADPAADFAVNLGGTLHVLEAARAQRDPPPVIFASTNKVYGELADVALESIENAYLPADPALRDQGIAEDRPIDFHTPYGCSKGGADQYVLDYARSFGVKTAVLRMSCIYGPRQMGTEDQGWVAHFLIRALTGEPIVLYGDGRQVRDILDVSDAVAAYRGCWAAIDSVCGRAFNLGGGPDNAVSLRQVISAIEEVVGRHVETVEAPWRAGDQRYFVADPRRIMDALDLPRPRPWREGLADLAEWLRRERGAPPAAPRPAGGDTRMQGAAS